MTKKRVLLLVDSVSYVRGEIYQHQLLEAFDARHDLDVRFVELQQMTYPNAASGFDRIVSLLKIRTLDAHRERVRAFLGSTPVMIVDYDPWVNFVDGSPYRGCYQRIASTINVGSFYVSAQTWANKVTQELGLPCRFVKLGMLSKYCSFTPWRERMREIEFKGTRHSWRVAGHERLLMAGLPVVWDPFVVKPYDAFLNYLSTVRVWAHSEIGAWTINGKQIVPNAVWPKGIEALARGCFVIRDAQEEMLHYDSEKMPALLTFNNESEAPVVYEKLLSLSDEQRDNMMRETVHFIGSCKYYDRIVEQLVDQ